MILSVSIIDFALIGMSAVAETAFYGTMFLPAWLAASVIIGLRRRQLRRERELMRNFSLGSARDGIGNRRDGSSR